MMMMMTTTAMTMILFSGTLGASLLTITQLDVDDDYNVYDDDDGDENGGEDA